MMLTMPKLLAGILILSGFQLAKSCDMPFDGFGIYVGSPTHMDGTNVSFVQTILDLLYNDLELRHYRINYLPNFSPAPNQYTIKCSTSNCDWAWEAVLEEFSNTSKYPNITLISSIWTAPYRMKNNVTHQLLPSAETDFYYFIKNITNLIQDTYGLTIESVSPVNEPDNAFAAWDHTNMTPDQLCTMVTKWNDPLTSFCPEASHLWLSDFFMHYVNPVTGYSCANACDVILTHAYALDLRPTSPNFLLAYYDPFVHKTTAWGNRRRWMTEVCSTFHYAESTQVKEGLDFARNIINFVGSTCVERYYFWFAYTEFSSGESLLWGDYQGHLIYPKKYFVYKHFTRASSLVGRNATVRNCDEVNLLATPGKCLILKSKDSDSEMAVFMNRESTTLNLNVNCSTHFCCTTEEFDYKCDWDVTNVLPAESVCACAPDSSISLSTNVIY